MTSFFDDIIGGSKFHYFFNTDHFCPLSRFFCAKSFQQKNFLLQIDLTLSQTSSQITPENLKMINKVKENFEVSRCHFPKSEHFLAKVYL